MRRRRGNARVGRPAVGEQAAEAALSAQVVKERALRGALLVGGRGIVIRLLALGGSIVLARLLTPQDFGVIALGASVIAVGTLLAGGGLGAALIRRSGPPDRREFESLLGLQLSITVVLAVAVGGTAMLVDERGVVIAVMAAALPITVLQTPGSIQLERRLSYGKRVLVEVAEVVTYNVCAVVLVLMGYGIIGVAAAAVARSVAGLAVMSLVTPERVLRPRFDMKLIKPLMRFGLQFQAVGAVNLLRDQGLNAATAAFSGVATLGLWVVAYRVLQVPFLVLEALWRVSYPAMSRLLEGGADLVPILRRTAQGSAVAATVVLVPLAVSSPLLVPVVFGPQWVDAVPALLPGFAGLIVSGPISVVAAGYLYALGQSRTLLNAAILHTFAWLLVSVPLLPRVGVLALGLGWLAASLTDAVVLLLAMRKRVPMSCLTPLVIPTLVALGVSAAGAWAVSSLDASLQSALVSGVGSLCALLLGLGLFAPSSLSMTAAMCRRALTRRAATTSS